MQMWLTRLNRALTHDFCPGANRWVYWLKRPVWGLALAACLSAVCGVFLRPEAFLITLLLGVLLLSGVLLPWLVMHGITLHVAFDIRRSRVGQSALIRLKVQNRWPFPVWGLSVLRGFVTSDAADTSEGVSLTRVAGWSTTEYSWPFTPVIRGRYPLVPPEIETAFPFGLYRATRSATVDGHLIVWPKTVMLTGLPDTSDLQSDEDTFTDRRIGDFGDMLGTRPFRHGDSLRRVHWAQTARQQQLIVCERQAPATSLVQVIVDTDPASHPGVASGDGRNPADTLELVVRAAASICESLHRQHCRVELIIEDQLIVAGESASGFQRLMDELSQVTVADSTRVMRHSFRTDDAFRVLVTTPAGMRWRSGQINRMHVVSVSDSTSLHRPADVPAWISIDGAADLESRLAAQWKGACNVR